MNRLASESKHSQNRHHWMLWVSPDTEQTKQLRNWPTTLKSRVLILKPRKPHLLARALLDAIESGNYAMITLPSDCLCELDNWKIKQAATAYGTALAYREQA